MTRTHDSLQAELPDLLARPWRRPLLWFHALRCEDCRTCLGRLRKVDLLLREACTRAADVASGTVERSKQRAQAE